MPIEEIAAGDMVFGEDPETGEQGYFEVVSVRSHVKAELVQVTISAEDADDEEPIDGSSDDQTDDTPSQTEVMTTTPDHPVYIEGKGWMWAENLELGDRLRRTDGGMAKVLALERIQLDEPEQVYNFTVKGPHTYFVLDITILVHNVSATLCEYNPQTNRWHAKQDLNINGRNYKRGQFVPTTEIDDYIAVPHTDVVLPREYVEALETLGIDQKQIFDHYSRLANSNIDVATFIDDFLANNPHGLNALDAHVIFGYTTNLFYDKLNHSLRNSVNLAQTTRIKNLINDALHKLPPISGTHYRGINLTNQTVLQDFLRKHTPGKRVTYDDFVSAADNKQKWWYRSNIRITIEPQNARDISDLAFGVNFQDRVGKGPNYPQESLFAAGTTFDVSGTEPRTENGQIIYYILLQQ